MMRILQGVTGQAGQPYMLAKTFRRLGYEAHCISIVEHAFGYQYDELIQGVNLSDPVHITDIVERLADRFDIFHFHGRAFAPFVPDLKFPCFSDLLQLKRYGKKTFFHFRGGELREEQRFAEVNPFAYSYEVGSERLFGSQTDDQKRLMKRVISDICTDVFVVDNELRTYLPEAKVMPRAIDLSEWEYVMPSKRDKPLVVHAPSRRVVKGTDHVLSAVEELRADGVDFDFRLVEGLSNFEAKEIFREADIIIDQLRIGWYGVLAVEAMALGKTVIVYIRDDLVTKGLEEVPVINANPNTIKNALEYAIRDREFRHQISQRAREYVERVHCSEAVCRRLIDAYQVPARTDMTYSLFDLHNYQCNQAFQALSSHKAIAKERESKFESRIETLSAAVNNQNGRIEKMKARIETLSAAVNNQNGRIEKMKARIETLSAAVKTLKGRN